jgi:uncharacterized protein (TIGR02594 family)
MNTYQLAQRFVGEVKEWPGNKHNPLIQWWHSLCGLPDTPDEVPWCSSFVNGIAWLLRLPRSKSAAARSWLKVGVPVSMSQAALGDVVVLQRGSGPQPGPEVTSGAPGHVGFYAGREGAHVLVLGGNQSNEVNVSRYPLERVLGVRRLNG